MKKKITKTILSILFSGLIVSSFTNSTLAQPANDDCSGATSINVAASKASCSTVTANTTAATTESYSSNCWVTSFDDGVWYQFTATASGVAIFVSNKSVSAGTISYAILNACGGTEVVCGSLVGDSGIATGLTTSQTYYLSVFYFGTTDRGTFDLCLVTPPSPPTNDDCSGAISINVAASKASCSPVTVNTTAATAESYSSNCWSSSYDDGVWYQFTATASGVAIFVSNKSVSTGDIGYAIFDACGGTEVVCGTLVGDAGIATGLTTSQTYYLSVFYIGTTDRGMFDLCLVTPPSPPANDDCSGAINIAVAANSSSCTTTTVDASLGATESTPASTCAAGFPDVWYQFTATGPSITALAGNISPTVIGYTIELLDACAGTSVACGVNTFTGLTTGNTYFLRVIFNGYGTMDICIFLTPPPPANDNCSAAITLNAAANKAACISTNVSTISATKSTEPISCSVNDIDDDVWYKFVAIDTAMTVQASNFWGITSGVGLTLYKGSCSGAESVECVNFAFGDSLRFGGLKKDTTYYLRIFSSNTTQQGTFDICVFGYGSPPPIPVADFTFSGSPAVQFTDLSNNNPTSWSWTFGDGGVATNQSPLHTYTANGNYNVCLTASNINGSDTKCKSVVINNVGLPSSQSLIYEINIFPNPSSGTFTLNSNLPVKEILKVEVVNLLGQTVLVRDFNSNTKSTFDLSAQPEGIYFVKIKTSEATVSRKIVVSK